MCDALNLSNSAEKNRFFYRLNDDSSGSIHNFLTITSTIRHINVWIVLKEVKPDSGPLWIVPGSHRLTENHFEQVMNFQPALAARLATMRESGAAIEDWRQLEQDINAVSTAMLARYVDERHLARVPLLLNRGDVVIFHERLIHGTFKKSCADQSRWCLVAQYGSVSHPRSGYFYDSSLLNSV